MNEEELKKQQAEKKAQESLNKEIGHMARQIELQKLKKEKEKLEKQQEQSYTNSNKTR